MKPISPLARAFAAQDDADMHAGSPEDVRHAYFVAADAWLEVGEPGRAAHALMAAAEQRSRYGAGQRLTLAEAAAIAEIAGWLERDSRGTLRPFSRSGVSLLGWLFRLTVIPANRRPPYRGPNLPGLGTPRSELDTDPHSIDEFRELLTSELRTRPARARGTRR